MYNEVLLDLHEEDRQCKSSDDKGIAIRIYKPLQMDMARVLYVMGKGGA